MGQYDSCVESGKPSEPKMYTSTDIDGVLASNATSSDRTASFDFKSDELKTYPESEVIQKCIKAFNNDELRMCHDDPTEKDIILDRTAIPVCGEQYNESNKLNCHNGFNK